MDSSFLQLLSDFIAETEPLAEKVDELTKETASELYSMYDTAAKAATLNIRVIDPELRVMLCDKQDRILERIVDIDRSFERSGIQGIFTPAVQGYRRWVNVELLKDKCLTGYMLAKELDTRSTMMFCSKPADYPNKELLPSLEILYSDAEVNVKNLICNKIPYQLYRSLSAIREPGPVPGNPLKSTVGPN
ncbi:MAG: hypothetical protein LBB94_03170, partial [Clostridiales bacterium]|nr:hypothetical protein [Clostridiales bacterium]